MKQEKVKSLSQEQIKSATVTPVEVKEPSVEIKYQSRTHKLPKFIRVTQDVEQTKVYKPIEEDEDIDYSYYNDKYNKTLNILLMVFIVILIIIISVAVFIMLHLMGVI